MNHIIVFFHDDIVNPDNTCKSNIHIGMYQWMGRATGREIETRLGLEKVDLKNPYVELNRKK
jgi:hypothetical protein